MNIRVFDFLNISNYRSIWADSGFHLQKCIINSLTKDGEFHFYLTIPKTEPVRDIIKAFKYPEYVTLIPIEYDAKYTMNKYHFNGVELDDVVDMKHRDYDVVWNNEPYLTSNFLQLFNIQNHFNIPLMNFIHWIDIPRILRIGDNENGNYAIWSLIAGIRWADASFTDSWYGKKLVAHFYNKLLSKEQIDVVDKKLESLPLGIDTEELDSYKPDVIDKSNIPSIIFNHRVTDYTGYEILLAVIKKLERDGLKFKVIVTNPSKFRGEGELEHMKSVKFLRKTLSFPDYIKLLYKTDIISCLHLGYSQWSLSSLEAMYCGNIPLAMESSFYEEMLGKKNKQWIVSKDNVYNRLKDMILNIEDYRKKGKYLKNFVKQKYAWINIKDMWEDKIKEVIGSTYIYDSSEKFIKRFLRVFQDYPSISKAQMLKRLGWGSQVKWTSYRRMMLDTYPIVDDLTKDHAYFTFLGNTKQQTLIPTPDIEKEYIERQHIDGYFKDQGKPI